MADKKTRQMTARGFLAKTNTKAANSAAAFLQAHRDYLTTGELASATSPILAKLDAKELLPTPALHEIAQAVLNHIVESDRQKLEANIEKASSPSGANKPWLAQIIDAHGNICTRLNAQGVEEDLIKGFDHASDADRWVDRRLYEGASDWHGEVDGLGTHTYTSRLDAMSRMDKKPKGPAIHQRGKSTKTLGFGVRAKQDRASFSRG